jgi:8-hydroxy-5-deazaflavin:NADPH oxidoreductase
MFMLPDRRAGRSIARLVSARPALASGRPPGRIGSVSASATQPGVSGTAASRAETEQQSVADRAAGLVLGVLGGTGDQGRGLAFRFARAGNTVIIGSRDPARAESAAASLRMAGQVTGRSNADAASAADVVIAAVPWDGHGTLLASLADPLAGKIVIDCVNPIGFDQRGAYPLRVAEGSAAEQAAALLPGSTVVGAFHHVSAVLLLDPEVSSVDLDVLVLGDDRAATDLVQALAERIPGVRGVYAGRLRNCGQVEALTANLVSINRRYKAHAGLRVTDI